MSLELGNVTYDVSVDGQNIGQSTINNLYLVPGNNTVPLRSTTNQTAVIDLITTKYKDGILPLDIIGNSSVYNGQHLPYFEAAIRQNPQRINLNLGPALGQIGLNLSTLTGGGGL